VVYFPTVAFVGRPGHACSINVVQGIAVGSENEHSMC
jgi:hypothetical protein